MSEPHSASAALSLAGYDFVDFGSSKGGSIEFSKQKLGGTRGLGLDIDAQKIATSRAAGFDVEQADVTQLDPSKVGTTRFVTMMHFLEHLNGVSFAEKCIVSAVNIADEFVFIRQPFFDADDYLAALGLKLYWSDWHGHRNHMKIAELRSVLDDLLLRKQIRRYIIFRRTPVEDSNDPCVHPASSPRNQHDWQAGKHPPKPFFKFHVPVFREIGAVIHTRALKLDEKPRRFLLSCDIAYDSSPVQPRV
jgi:hypothetical protein